MGIFRNFMGIGPHRRQPYQRHDDEVNPDAPQFFHGMSDIMDEMDQMFQSFDDIFKSMGFGEIPHGHAHGFDFQLPGLEDDPQCLPPRDHMLKEPGQSEESTKPNIKKWDLNPRFQPRQNEKKDTDLDDEVSRGEIGSLFGNPDQNTGIVPQPRTYFKSVTIRTVRTPDGKVQQEKTVRDGSGKEETTITTTEPSSDSQGFGNFQRDMPMFDRMWNFRNIFGHESSSEEKEINPLKENHNDNKNSIFRNLFDSLFGDKKS